MTYKAAGKTTDEIIKDYQALIKRGNFLKLMEVAAVFVCGMFTSIILIVATIMLYAMLK